MIRNKLAIRVLAGLAIAQAGTPAFGQGRGRTDGPEGSEYGKGGYERIGGLSGRLSLQVDWGGAVEGETTNRYPTNGSPLFLGGTVTYWNTDWFLVDLSGAYIFTSQKGEVLVGPRFRLPYYPVGLSVGIKAGPIFIPNLGTRFGISPIVGVDLSLIDHLVLGLNYAPDIAVGSGGVTHRFYMSVGYRF
jgi:hypothetical protein